MSCSIPDGVKEEACRRTARLFLFEGFAQFTGDARALGQHEGDIAVGGDEARALADELGLARDVAVAADAGDFSVGLVTEITRSSAAMCSGLPKVRACPWRSADRWNRRGSRRCRHCGDLLDVLQALDRLDHAHHQRVVVQRCRRLADRHRPIVENRIHTRDRALADGREPGAVEARCASAAVLMSGKTMPVTPLSSNTAVFGSSQLPTRASGATPQPSATCAI